MLRGRTARSTDWTNRGFAQTASGRSMLIVRYQLALHGSINLMRVRQLSVQGLSVLPQLSAGEDVLLIREG